MSDSADLINLYSKRILALAASIPSAERLTAPDASVSKRSPLCGSMITVDVKMARGKVAEFGQDVKACALGQASASVLGAHAVGLDLAQARAARDALRAMLKEGAEPPGGDFKDLEVLSPARAYKNRHASIMLAYEALVEAIEIAEARDGACGAGCS